MKQRLKVATKKILETDIQDKVHNDTTFKCTSVRPILWAILLPTFDEL